MAYTVKKKPVGHVKRAKLQHPGHTKPETAGRTKHKVHPAQKSTNPTHKMNVMPPGEGIDAMHDIPMKRIVGKDYGGKMKGRGNEE